MCDIGQRNVDGNFYKSMDRGTELNLETLEKMANELSGQYSYIRINGTEPLLYKDIGRAIEIFTERKIKVSVTTNGYLLQEKADDLLNSKIDHIVVSIDGLEEIHDRVRGVKGSFKRAFDGMGEMLEKRERDMIVRCAIAVSPYNYHKLYSTAEMIHKRGCDSITFSHLNFITDRMAIQHNERFSKEFGKVTPSSVSSLKPTDIDVNVLVDQVNSIFRDFGKFVHFIPTIEGAELKKYYQEPIEPVFSNRCRVAWNNIQVLSDGAVIPASRCFNIPLGNVNESSIKEIWHGNGFSTFRKNIDMIRSTSACWRCCSIFSKRTLDKG